MPANRAVKILATVILILMANNVKSQVTENHIGVRGGIHSGVYYQNLIAAGNAERSFFAMLSANTNSVRITIMRLTYEMSLNEFTDNLYFIWGYGGHAGFTVTDHAWFLGKKYQFEYERFRPVAGVDAYGGLEYRFIGMPLTLGLSVKPFVELMVPGFINIQPLDIGISFAYRF